MKGRIVIQYGLVSVGLLLAGVMLLPGKAVAPPPLERRPISPEMRKEIQKPEVSPPRTDLRVEKIYAQDCNGSCEGDDVFYMNGIYVKVGNYNYNCATPSGSIRGSGVKARVKITVTYYAVSAGTPRTFVRSSTFEVGRSYTLRVSQNPLCLRRSAGIHAEIQPTGEIRGIKITDPCQENNVRILKYCRP